MRSRRSGAPGSEMSIMSRCGRPARSARLNAWRARRGCSGRRGSARRDSSTTSRLFLGRPPAGTADTAADAPDPLDSHLVEGHTVVAEPCLEYGLLPGRYRGRGAPFRHPVLVGDEDAEITLALVELARDRFGLTREEDEFGDADEVTAEGLHLVMVDFFEGRGVEGGGRGEPVDAHGHRQAVAGHAGIDAFGSGNAELHDRRSGARPRRAGAEHRGKRQDKQELCETIHYGRSL